MRYNPKEMATLEEIDFLNELDILLIQNEISQHAYANLKTRFYEILRTSKTEVQHEQSYIPNSF